MMNFRHVRAVMLASLLILSAASSAWADDVAPRKGHLVIHGGGESHGALPEFLRLAGGETAKVVVIPTAAGREQYDERFQADYFRPFREGGVATIQLLHTTDRRIADSDDFVAPLADATGVWFTGGRQWRIADAYLGTKTERALWAVLERGGVVGGGSAGATIQGSYLIRGDTRGALLTMGDHQRGFGFLKNTAIDQHLLDRNRHLDLLAVVRAHPTLLGIGLDNDAAIVVHGDEFRVIGPDYVAIYDPRLVLENGAFYFLQKGQRFRLSTRTPLSPDGKELWMPHIQPRAKLTRQQLRDITGEYRAGSHSVFVKIVGGRIDAMLCPGDHGELIPLSPDLFYDSADGSRVAVHRTDRGAVAGLTWRVERSAGQQRCVSGEIRMTKVGRGK